jgi:hypothetical protein
MQGYGEEYGVSYRTLRKIFEVLKVRQLEAEARFMAIDNNIVNGDLFGDGDENVGSLKPFTYTVTVSMMEIYNDQVYDLLSGSNECLDIRQSAEGDVHVPGLIQVPVMNGLQDVLAVFAKGCLLSVCFSSVLQCIS